MVSPRCKRGLVGTYEMISRLITVVGAAKHTRLIEHQQRRRKIGSVRTVLFGNLIPIFSTLEAVWLLGETITVVHIISGALVITGLVLANFKKAQGKKITIEKL